MRFSSDLVTVHLVEVFRTSRGEADSKVSCAVSLGSSLGECCPSLHYGYSAEECHDFIQSTEMDVDVEKSSLNEVLGQLYELCGERHSLIAGLDIALFDLVSRNAGQALWKYLHLPDPSGRESSYTISVDDPAGTERRLKEAADFRILKLKLGGEYDQDNLEILRRLPGRLIRVDANGAFDLSTIEWLVRAANDFGIELIEEPLSHPDCPSLCDLQNELKCPVVLDESIVCTDDVRIYRESVRGVNIKLQKVGGVGRALEMLQTARDLGMKIMIGCMLETSIGISASANLAGAVDFIDLDSNMLLTDDPFAGAHLEDSRLVLADRPGHGAVRRDTL